MSNSVLPITDAEFAPEVLDATQPVLVYFWAAWCGPCRLMSPTVDWAAGHYGDRLKIVKVEIDPNPETVSEYQVEGVPALRLFQAGKVVEAFEGAINKQKLQSWLDDHLPSTAS
jgi:thioredoxin 1